MMRILYKRAIYKINVKYKYINKGKKQIINEKNSNKTKRDDQTHQVPDTINIELKLKLIIEANNED